MTDGTKACRSIDRRGSSSSIITSQLQNRRLSWGSRRWSRSHVGPWRLRMAVRSRSCPLLDCLPGGVEGDCSLGFAPQWPGSPLDACALGKRPSSTVAAGLACVVKAIAWVVRDVAWAREWCHLGRSVGQVVGKSEDRVFERLCPGPFPSSVLQLRTRQWPML